MIKLYKTTDRIPVKIGAIEIHLSPLSYDQKRQIMECSSLQSGTTFADQMKASFLAIKFSVKQLKGVQLSDGTDYLLEFDQDGNLTDECVGDLVNLDNVAQLYNVCSSLINGVQEKELDGVKYKLDKVYSVKKK